MGAFRFNDPERNIMIASTDLVLSKAPMIYESSQRLRSREGALNEKPHYSISNKGGDKLWGTHDVYADDFVQDDAFHFVLSYK